MAAMTTAELATALETTPRTLRKFLRSDASGIDSVGKGARYSIEKRQVRSLTAKFAKWTAAQEATNSDNSPESPEEPTED